MLSLFKPDAGFVQQPKAWARRQAAARINEVDAYIDELFRLCDLYRLNFVTMISQSAHETANWTSARWRNNLNPSGIGVTGANGANGLTYASGREAARAHIYHMLLYTSGTPAANTVAAGWRRLDPRAEAVEQSAMYAKATNLNDLTGTWAIDPLYAKKIADLSRAIFEFSGGSTVSLPIYRELLTAGSNFPNERLSHQNLWITIHETANKNVGADAKMHKNFVLGGGGQYKVSFHFAVDDQEAWQIMRLDQVGWHASDGCNDRQKDIGCFGSVAIETCVNSDGDWSKTIKNLISLITAIIAGDSRLDYGTANAARFSVDRIATHNRWADNKKWCPTNILNQNLLPAIIAGVKANLTPQISTPVYDQPSRPTFLTNQAELDKFIDRQIGSTKIYAARRQYTAIRDTPRLKNTDPNSPIVGPDIKSGEIFMGEFVYKSNNQWWVLTSFGTRVKMADVKPRVEFAE